jgi:hypothetical protein
MPSMKRWSAISDAVNEALVRDLMHSGIGMVSSTRVRGVYAIRMCVLTHRTRLEDILRVLEFLAASELDGV